MDIRNLQAYPTQFLPKPTPLGTENKSEDDRYLVRGNKFIDLTFVSHRSFDGLTAGKGRQEINGEVSKNTATISLRARALCLGSPPLSGGSEACHTPSQAPCRK